MGLALLLCLGLLITACGTAPSRPPEKGAAASGAAVSPPGPADAALAARLVVERDWLRAWFKDTPVVIAQQDAALGVEVPLAFCFDPGRSEVKPALGAVLDKVAESLRRNPQARLQLLAAPGDTASAAQAALATQRGQRVRAHLRSRGVPDARLPAAARSAVAAVQMRMGEGAL